MAIAMSLNWGIRTHVELWETNNFDDFLNHTWEVAIQQ